LARAPGRLFTREILLENVWGYTYAGDAKLVDTHIYRLRAKIEDDPSDPSLILTVRGLGYKAAP
jgi:two-component system response regulator MtrA